MNTEQLRAEFEAWAASIGFCVTGKYAETIDVLCAESAFKAGYQAGRAALQSQDREDAERYRYLSSIATQQADSLGPIFRIDVRRTPQTLFNFNAAVDHARRAREGGE